MCTVLTVHFTDLVSKHLVKDPQECSFNKVSCQGGGVLQMRPFSPIHPLSYTKNFAPKGFVDMYTLLHAFLEVGTPDIYLFTDRPYKTEAINGFFQPPTCIH